MDNHNVQGEQDSEKHFFKVTSQKAAEVVLQANWARGILYFVHI